MLNFYFKDDINSFLQRPIEEIIGTMLMSNDYDVTGLQKRAWEYQINILKNSLTGYDGVLFFEFSIPRMGKRVDALVLIKNVVFVIEFKVGETNYHSYQIEQVWDYALDLKNFHKPSHALMLAPILIATEARRSFIEIATTSHNDNLLLPIRTNRSDLRKVIDSVLNFSLDAPSIDKNSFANGIYSPTPTIVEAAVALFQNHTVEDITRSDAGVKNLSTTTSFISTLIEKAKDKQQKIICFVTGVPGAGKHLSG